VKQVFKSHPKTPDLLSENSLLMEQLFAAEPFDDEKFASLVEEREKLISAFLQGLTLDAQSRSFITAEIDNYQNMIDFSTLLREKTRQELSKFVKSQNAIKNYK